MRSSVKYALLAACISFGFGTADASAGMIVADYSAAPYTIDDKDVTDVFKLNFDCAMFMWRSVFPTQRINLTIEVLVGTLPLTQPAGTRYLTKDPKTGFITKAGILFNDRVDWFFDPTPHENSEFAMTTSELNRNPATTDDVNSGRFGLATDAKAKDKFDFQSIALHEIGHALGIGLNEKDPANYALYEQEVKDFDIDIDAEFAGLFPKGILPVKSIPVTGNHFSGFQVRDFRRTSMAGGVTWKDSIRVFPSDLDILGIASVYNLKKNEITLDPTQCPEPSTLLLLATGVVCSIVYGGIRRDWRRRNRGRSQTAVEENL